MKLNVTNLLTVAAVAALHLSACNTIKGMLGGDGETKTESEPTSEPAKTEAPADTAPALTASAEPSAAPTAEVPTIAAVNEADVKRFDDEQKLAAPADTKIKDKATSVLAQPPDGAVVALLKPGHDVKVLAEREGFTLLAFQNPSKPDETLMGWTKSDLVEPVATAAAPAAPSEPCIPGFTKVFVGTTERCEVVCTSNAGCPTGQTCGGSAKASNEGVPGDAVKFCATRSAAPAPTAPPPKKKKSEPPPEEGKDKKKKTKPKKKTDD